MERKLLTADDLETLDDITPYDKGVIEAAVENFGGYYGEVPETVLHKAIRGYLAQEFLDLVPNDDLREGAAGDAASFVDGWEWCLEHGKK